jgi:5-methylcytosine-specific restriction endonuclease McrA
VARIRTIKPEFWADEKVAALTPMARLAFIGSWNLADDEGLTRWTTDFINASLFMYDGLNAKRVQSLMDEISDAGLVFTYTTGTRQRLAYIVNFRKHQRINRPQPGKLPPPPLQSDDVRTMYGERDQWICHLCKGPINRTRILPPLDLYDGKPREGSVDLNLSLDHIEPRSLGGSDYPSNISASHVACNKGRCNRPIEEFTVPQSVSRALNGSVNEAVSAQ